MNLRKSITTVAAAIAMVAVPTVASAAQSSASRLSVAPAVTKSVRASSAQTKNNNLGGSVIIAVLAAAAVIAGIAIAADGSNDAVSP